MEEIVEVPQLLLQEHIQERVAEKCLNFLFLPLMWENVQLLFAPQSKEDDVDVLLDGMHVIPQDCVQDRPQENVMPSESGDDMVGTTGEDIV